MYPYVKDTFPQQPRYVKHLLKIEMVVILFLLLSLHVNQVVHTVLEKSFWMILKIYSAYETLFSVRNQNVVYLKFLQLKKRFFRMLSIMLLHAVNFQHRLLVK